MKIKIVSILAAVLFLASCQKYETATITVQNKVHNAILTDLTFGKQNFSGRLIPGETTYELLIEEEEDMWPISFPIKFYMEANGQKVLLYTRDSYTLSPNQELNVVISDTTVVESPLQ